VRPEEVLTVGISIPSAQVPDDERAIRGHEQIIQRIRQIPGVTSVAVSTSLDMNGNGANDPIFVEDYPTPEGQIPVVRRFKWISGGYFATMGNPIIAGRDITWTDTYNKAPVALVSESFVRVYWKQPGAALGKRIRETPSGPWREIIGVVGDERANGVNQKAPPIVYWPMLMRDFWGQKLVAQRSMTYVIRSPRVGAVSFLKEIRDAVWSVNPNLPIADVRTLQEIYTRSMARTSFTLVMLGIAAAMALLLSVVGIYGVISYSVSQRTREIGIRMALGAPQQQVRRLFVRHGLLLTSIGVALGIGAAFAVTRVMSALLFEVSALDPVTYLAVSFGLVTAALLASYFPARKASIIDPVEALRAE
jgi:predicted permease